MEDLEKRLSKLKYTLSHSVFYPKGYVDVIFEDSTSMEKASTLLSEAGWDSEDIIPFKGEEVLKLYNQTVENRTVWEKFVVSFSSMMGGEDNFLEKNIEFARDGKYFLLAYAGNEKKAKEIRDVIKPSNPIRLFGYAPLFIVNMNLE